MKIRIALAGEPNCGKTTLFNALTGGKEYAGNRAGVTVEKKEGRYKGDKDVIITDLPGVYSLLPYSPEETAAREYLENERPDAILNVIDAADIERSLYLTTQLAEMGIPLVCAVNMMDIAKKNGIHLNTSALAEALGCEVIAISALKGTGITEAVNAAIRAARSGGEFAPKHRFSPQTEHTIGEIARLLPDSLKPNAKRRYAIELLSGGKVLCDKLGKNSDSIKDLVKDLEKLSGENSGAVIAGERHTYASAVVKKCVKQRPCSSADTSDRIDRVLTNRYLALPIFAAVMFVMYYVSVTAAGRAVSFAAQKISPFFHPSVTAAHILEKLNAPEWLRELFTEGIIGGAGSVLGFVPQLAVLFMFLAFLEDSGYMARVAFIMDRIFRNFGLSGKSFIPVLIASGCGVPAVLASRTVENDSERRMTVMTATFMPCSAKLPVIALTAGTFFGGSAWVAVSAYFAGIAAIAVSGLILKKSPVCGESKAPFLMEMPKYRLPSAGSIFRSVGERCSSFIVKAGTVILLSSVLMWFMQGCGFTESGFGRCDPAHSLLGTSGIWAARLFAPLGWGDKRLAAAALSGLIAKENIVAAFGVLGIQPAEVLTPLSAYSFLIFNLLCAPCIAAVSAIHKELGSLRLTAFALCWQTLLAYTVSLVIYQTGSLFCADIPVNPQGAAAAFILLAGTVYLLAKPSAENSAGKTSVPCLGFCKGCGKSFCREHSRI